MIAQSVLDELVAKMTAQGLTNEQIARRTGVPFERIVITARRLRGAVAGDADNSERRRQRRRAAAPAARVLRNNRKS